MSLHPCARCGVHVLATSCACPSCGTKLRDCSGALTTTAAALAMGLSLVACGDKDIQPAYGVPESSVFIDEDGDGYNGEGEDCDDGDAAVNPGATETPDDGIDSNCDGEDNT
ncbi:MAG: putative metal-binding motif-containing protein [Deltaproteobacteria bacterium]|nr:putative metal-binding motif-containing protein [Deltaproteobacteria bacterium]